MATDLNQLLEQTQAQSESMKGYSYFERRGATKQANEISAKNAQTAAALTDEKMDIAEEASRLNKDNIGNFYDRKADLMDYALRKTAEMDEELEGVRAMRDNTNEQIRSNIEKLNEINKAKESTNNPFAKLWHGIRYEMASNEQNADIRRHNMAVDNINATYDRVARDIEQFRNGEHVQNGLLFQRNKALKQEELRLRGEKVGHIAALGAYNEQQVQNIFARTAINPNSLGDEELMKSGIHEYFYRMSGGEGSPSLQDRKTIDGYLKVMPREEVLKHMRMNRLWEEGKKKGVDLGPEEMLSEAAQNGGITEVMALANIMPDYGASQLAKMGVKKTEEKVQAEVQVEFVQAEVAAGRLDSEAVAKGEYQLNEDQLERMKELQQKRLGETLSASTGKSVIEPYVNGLAQAEVEKVMDPSGSNIRPETFTNDPVFTEQVLPKYNVKTDDFMKAMGDDEFREVFTTASNNPQGLLAKRQVLESQLAKIPGLSETEAAKMATEMFAIKHTGMILESNPMLIYSNDLGVEPTFKLNVTQRLAKPGSNETEEHTVDLLNAADVENASARGAKNLKDRVQQTRQRINFGGGPGPFGSQGR